MAKLMKIWEAKAAKRAAKASGFTLMAVSLAACQSDATDAALSVTAVDADLTDFVGETKEALVDAIKTSNDADIAAAVDITSDNAAAILGAVKAVDADAATVQDVFDAGFDAGYDGSAQDLVDTVNELLGTEFTVDTPGADLIAAVAASDNEAEILAALQELVPDAETVEDVFDAGAASRDDEVATLTEDLDAANETIDVRDGTIGELTEDLDAANETIDVRDGTIVELTEDLDDLLGDLATQDLLTLSLASEVVDVTGLGDDVTFTVEGLTAYDDDQIVTISSDGTGTLTFNFLDSDDTLTLTGTSDISGFTAISIVGGTVDLTAVDVSGVDSITVASGVVMTAAQFLAVESIVVADARGLVEVAVATAVEAAAVIAAQAKVTGLDASRDTFALVASEDAADDLNIVAQNTALNSEIIQGTINTELPTALQTLQTANIAVSAQEAAIADFLEEAFENEFVAALADDDDDGELNGDEVVVEADIADANEDAAVVFEDSVAAGNGAAFVALTDARQDFQISIARTNFNNDITFAEADLEDAEDALGEGVADLVVGVDEAAEDLTEALDAVADADGDITFALAVAGAVAETGDVDVEDPNIEPGAAVFTDADGVITVTVTDDDDPANETTLALSEVTEGVVALVDAVTLSEDETTYTFQTTDGEGTPVLYDVTIAASVLDDLVAAVQAELDALAAQEDAEEALGDAINAVLNAQNAELEAFTYEELSAEGAVADGVPVAGSGVIVVGEDNAVTIDYDGDDADEGVTVDGVTAVNTYVVAVTALSDAQEALSDFNDAVAAWEETVVLVDELADLNETLESLEVAVTAAEDAITNATDAEVDAGLGLNLVAFEDDAAASEASDVFVFESDLNQTITIGAFGAAGTDRLFFGEDFTFVEMDADAEISDSLGDVAVLEIFAEETADGVTLYIEGIASAGLSSGTVDMTIVELDDITLADLSFDTSGILTATAAIV